MSYTILYFDEVPVGTWDSLVRESPDGFVYALSCWRDVILAVEPWGLKDFSFALSDGTRLLGVMPLQYREANKTMASSGWGGSGPIAAGRLGHKQRKKVFTAMLAHAEVLAKEKNAKQLTFNVLPITNTSLSAKWGVNPWSEYGFEDISGVSRVLDLSQDEEILWRGLSETARHAVKYARREGYFVEKAAWPDELENYYRLHVETYTRTGVSPHSVAYFKGIAAYSAPLRHSILWVCRNAEEKPVAYHNSTVMEKGGVYNTGCSSQELAGQYAGYLLFWELMLGLKALGVRWYECGDISWGNTKDGSSPSKLAGLTGYKTKFGGENHRSFRCEKQISTPTEDIRLAPLPSKGQALEKILSSGKGLLAAVTSPKFADSSAKFVKMPLRFFQKIFRKGTSTSSASSVFQSDNREFFVDSSLYMAEKIARPVPETPEGGYIDQLTWEKFALVKKHAANGPLLDICCGNGAHLSCLSWHTDKKVGIDYSQNYIDYANAHYASTDPPVSFFQGDCTAMPFDDNSFRILYCFSAIYLLKEPHLFFPEMKRVLLPGGCAILDLGNIRSLNALCIKLYAEEDGYASLVCSSIEAQLGMLREVGFEILEHRSFQLLPLWAGKPKWLYPLLHPRWNDIMKKRIKGKMLDEWVSSAPLLRQFAFRHLVVCRKPE